MAKGFVSKKIAAILSFRKSGKVVAEFIEQLYASKNYWAFEQIYYSTRRSKNPYQPSFRTIDGIPFEGSITCGHNPYLYARRVRNIEAYTDEDGNEVVTWELSRGKIVDKKPVLTWHSDSLIEVHHP